MSGLTFDPDTHIYRLNGVEIPSATQLARFCSVDIDKSRPWLAQGAADRGSRVHAYTMLMDYGEQPETVDADCLGYLKAYQRFLHDYRPDWDAIEYTGTAHLAGVDFAGTIDRVGKVGGVPSVLDIKTGLLHPASLAVQLTAYALVCGNAPFCKEYQHLTLAALKLSKDGTYELKPVEYRGDLLASCISLHSALQKKARKHNGK
jgi:hypothetical protein